jgi:ankyrin repeat protein
MDGAIREHIHKKIFQELLGSLDNSDSDEKFPNKLFEKLHSFSQQGRLVEEKSQIDSVRELLSQPDFQDKEQLNAKNKKGETVLYYAIKYRLFRIARLLVEAGADACEPKSNSPLALLFCGTKGLFAATTMSFVIWLCGELDRQGRRHDMADILNSEKVGSLVLNRKAPQEEMLSILLKYGADPNKRIFGWTPLHIVAKRGHTYMAKMLIDRGADINATKNDGMTPLHLAALNGNIQVVILLLKHGASNFIRCGDSEDNPEFSGSTPSQAAFISKHTGIGLTIQEWHIWHGQSTNESGNLAQQPSSSMPAASSCSTVPMRNDDNDSTDKPSCP